MNIEILIVTYAKDIGWLEHCLRSIRKFGTGFAGVTLVVPVQEFSAFQEIATDFECKLKSYWRTENSEKWHLHAQAQKCLADIYCPDADFILHQDSDCIWKEPFTPEDYFKAGKPFMCIEPYSRISSPWKAVVERALGIPVEFETMRRHPQVNPKGVYKDMRARIEGAHNTDFLSYVLSCKGTFPWGFTEHNTIGAFALSDPIWQSHYDWIDLSKEPKPPDKVIQFWSYGPIDQPQDGPNSGIKVIPIEVINRILA